MQGMQVTGILIWSPYREGDGPLRLWKAFGKDLQAKNSPVISKKISNMAMSIIRDKIANMTIDEILKKRQLLKDQIKSALQVILTGWGIWMETIEISDVRICSGKLFGYMQTQFREEQRLKSTSIEGESNSKIRLEKLQRDTKNEHRDKKTAANLKKKNVTLAVDREKYSMQTEITRQAEVRKLEQAVHETKVKEVQNQLDLKTKSQDAELEGIKKDMQLESTCLTPNVLKAKLMDATELIQRTVKPRELKFVNIGEDSGVDGGPKDAVSATVRQMVTSFQTISNSVKN